MPTSTQNDPQPTPGDAERDPGADRPNVIEEPPAGAPAEERPLRDPPGHAPKQT